MVIFRILKRSLLLLSLALPLSCGGGGGGEQSFSSADPADKTLSIEVAVRTIKGLGASSAVTARSPILDQISASSFNDCPEITFEPDGAAFSYVLDFGSGCATSGLPFAISGSVGGSVRADARNFEVSSFYRDFSAGFGTVNGHSSGIYTLLGDASGGQLGIGADIDVVQSWSAPDFSIRVQGDLEERLMLSLTSPAPALQLAIDTAALSVTLNDRRQFAVHADNILIDTTAGLLPQSGSITVIDTVSASPNTVIVSFNETTPGTGVVSVTSSGTTESFDLNDLAL